MDGREVLRRIKAEPRWRATPVIMISGEQDMQGIIDCIEAGADDYLFKPFNPVLLQARIKAGIERKRWHDREQQYRDQLERNERFIRATFGRYLSDDIVTEILERPEGLELGGDLREVTIMMSDIRGFTTLSEQLPPDARGQHAQPLPRRHDRHHPAARRHDRRVPRRCDPRRVRGAAAPRRRPGPRRALRPGHAGGDGPRSTPPTAARAFRNCHGHRPEHGHVIAGNIGSERRSKYGFVGHAMNVTSRIEDVPAAARSSLPTRRVAPWGSYARRAARTAGAGHRRGADRLPAPGRSCGVSDDRAPAAGRGQRAEPRHAQPAPAPRRLRGALAADGSEALERIDERSGRTWCCWT
jgi:adenylate cyclase